MPKNTKKFEILNDIKEDTLLQKEIAEKHDVSVSYVSQVKHESIRKTNGNPSDNGKNDDQLEKIKEMIEQVKKESIDNTDGYNEIIKNDARAIIVEMDNLYFDTFKKILPDNLWKKFVRKRNDILRKCNLLQERYIPDDVKRKVWKRDHGICVKCFSKINIQYDHILPFSKGGANTVENLQLLCKRCNLKKSDYI